MGSVTLAPVRFTHALNSVRIIRHGHPVQSDFPQNADVQQRGYTLVMATSLDSHWHDQRQEVSVDDHDRGQIVDDPNLDEWTRASFERLD
jgi:hypothetical protein